MRGYELILSNAVVTYCAPRFYKFIELQECLNERSCLSNSFFVKPLQLDEDSKYVTYQKSGKTYYHFSEPKVGKEADIFSMLKENAEKNYKNNITVYFLPGFFLWCWCGIPTLDEGFALLPNLVVKLFVNLVGSGVRGTGAETAE